MRGSETWMTANAAMSRKVAASGAARGRTAILPPALRLRCCGVSGSHTSAARALIPQSAAAPMPAAL